MKRTICFCCQKGGVGKTTSSTTAAAAFTRDGKKAVLVDIDQQGNSSAVILEDPPQHTITEVLAGKIDPLQAVYPSEFGFILPCDGSLRESSISAPEQLKRIAEALQKRFDYVIFDCPPNLGKLTAAAMIASNYTIICATPSPMGYESAIRTMETIDGIRETKNPALKTAGILPNLVTRSTLSRVYLDSLGSIADGYKTVCFDPIRQGISIPESQMLHQPIFDYAPRSKQAEDYSRFYNQLKERIRRA